MTKKIKDYKKMAKEYLAGWQRAQADLDNWQKRTAKEKQVFLKLANADLISQILPILDNFNEAMNHISPKAKDESWVTGVGYIKQQLEEVLAKNNVKEIKVKQGSKFDPKIMEAISGKAKKNKVKKVLRPGYKLNGHLLRPAQVEVD